MTTTILTKNKRKEIWDGLPPIMEEWLQSTEAAKTPLEQEHWLWKKFMKVISKFSIEYVHGDHPIYFSVMPMLRSINVESGLDKNLSKKLQNIEHSYIMRGLSGENLREALSNDKIYQFLQKRIKGGREASAVYEWFSFGIWIDSRKKWVAIPNSDRNATNLGEFEKILEEIAPYGEKVIEEINTKNNISSTNWDKVPIVTIDDIEGDAPL